MTFRTPKPDDKDAAFMKTTIRIHKKIQARLKHAVIDLVVDESGERPTMDWFMQEAIARELDFAQHKGDQIMLDIKEIVALGSDRTQRMLVNYIAELLERARAEGTRRSPKTAG